MRAVVFDFDYTLADSATGIIDCIQTAQKVMALPISDEEAIRRTIGLSVPDILTTLNGEDQRDRAGEFARLFQERADEVMADNTVIYDSVPEVLRRLTDAGMRCAIASTKFRYRIEQILRRDGLADLVHAVIGAEDVAQHKPDPACLHASLARMDVSVGDAIYVGDSLPDAGAAQRVPMSFVAVLTGTTTRDAFAPFEPDVILADVSHLPDWINA